MARQSESAPLPGRALAGGKPVAPEARVRARDPETGAIQPHGVAGELEIKAPSCMVGYYGDEAATRAAFTADGFLRTGDLGYSTDDGGFVFLARLGDALRLSGFLVSPAEIEGVLQDASGRRGRAGRRRRDAGGHQGVRVRDRRAGGGVRRARR